MCWPRMNLTQHCSNKCFEANKWKSTLRTSQSKSNYMANMSAEYKWNWNNKFISVSKPTDICPKFRLMQSFSFLGRTDLRTTMAPFPLYPQLYFITPQHRLDQLKNITNIVVEWSVWVLILTRVIWAKWYSYPSAPMNNVLFVTCLSVTVNQEKGDDLLVCYAPVVC